MPVKPGQVVDVFQGLLEASIQITDRFFDRARLDSFHPIRQFCREWILMEGATLKISILSIENRELQAICIVGGLGSLREGDCIPNQPIQARAQLVSDLAEYKGKIIAFDSLHSGGVEVGRYGIPTGFFILASERSRTFVVKEGMPFGQELLVVNVSPIKSTPAVFEPTFHAGEFTDFAQPGV